MGNKPACVINHTVRKGESVYQIVRTDCKSTSPNEAKKLAIEWAQQKKKDVFDLTQWARLTRQKYPALGKLPIAAVKERINQDIAQALNRPEAPKDLKFVSIEAGDIIDMDVVRGEDGQLFIFKEQKQQPSVRDDYRLICYKDYRYTLPPCVFDEGLGTKKCEPPISVKISEREDCFGHKKPEAFFRIGDGKPQKIALMPYYKEKVYFKESNTNYECTATKVNKVAEAKVLGMEQTHPNIWRMIQPYLDGEEFFISSRQTFREIAASFLDEEWDEQKMCPYFRILTSDHFCYTERGRGSIPFSNGTSAITTQNIPTELKQCVPDWGGYDKYSDSEDMKRDRDCFWDTLVTSVSQADFSPANTGNVNVLEIGTGAAVAAVPLVEYLRKYQIVNGRERKVQYTGLDIDEESIKKARTINPSNFTFVKEDAAKFMDAHPDQSYDVVLFRHPGPMSDGDWSVGEPDIWDGLMRRAYDHLLPTGIIIVSALTCEEYVFSKRLFEDELGAKIYVAGKNPITNGEHRDAFILVVGKPSIMDVFAR